MERRQTQGVRWNNSVREADEFYVQPKGKTNWKKNLEVLLDRPDGWQCQCHQCSAVPKRTLSGLEFWLHHLTLTI